MSRFKSKNVIIFSVIIMYERLKDLREDKNKTQKDIAEIINMSRGQTNETKPYPRIKK